MENTTTTAAASQAIQIKFNIIPLEFITNDNWVTWKAEAFNGTYWIEKVGDKYFISHKFNNDEVVVFKRLPFSSLHDANEYAQEVNRQKMDDVIYDLKKFVSANVQISL